MGWFSIVFWILTHAGDLISLVKQILSLIHTLPKGDAMLAKSEIGEAVKSGNKETVKSIMEKWRDKCAASGGTACGGDLVK